MSSTSDITGTLTLTMLWADSADDKLVILFLVYQKIGSDTLCKLSPKATICMKCQILFSRKNKKNISKCPLLIFYSAFTVLRVNLDFFPTKVNVLKIRTLKRLTK